MSFFTNLSAFSCKCRRFCTFLSVFRSKTSGSTWNWAKTGVSAALVASLATIAPSCAITGFAIKLKCKHQDFEHFRCVTYPHFSRKKVEA